MQIRINGETFEAYREDGQTFVVAPCGCPECAERVQPGHVQCDTWPESLRAAARFGAVEALYVDQWRWRARPL